MKIAIGGSMQFMDQMVAVRDELQKLGHTAFVSKGEDKLVGQSDEAKEQIKLQQKFHENAIREFWDMMEGCDALLVLNYDKNGIQNYVGGNALLDMGLAYYLKQKIFLLYPIPDIPYYKTEIEAMQPVIINGDLSKIV
jgi:hypothetical protein